MGRMARLCALVLVVVTLGSCSDPGQDDDASRVAALSALAITDSQIDALDLGLVPWKSYSSTDADASALDELIAGPVDRASTTVVRSWALDPPVGSDAVPFAIVSSVLEFDSPIEAAVAMNSLLPESSPTKEIRRVRYWLRAPEEGVSMGFAVARTRALLLVTTAGFDGLGDESLIRSLAELLADG